MKKNLWDDSFLGHFLKRYLFLTVLFFTIGVWGQTTIASEGFNNTSTLFTVSGGAYYTGNSGTGDRPASSPFFAEGSYAYGFTAPSTTTASATLTSSNINTLGYSGVNLSFRLAAFSIGSTSNGLDGTDLVNVEVSPDGGTTYYSTVRVLGSSASNAFWAYSTGTGLATTAYDGNATPVDFQPTTSGSQTTSGYSTVSVTSLPAVSNLKIRITLTNNATSERWIVDDFKVTGTPGIISATTGNWSDSSTWVGGIVPTSADNVTIAAGHTVTITSASGTSLTRNSGTTTTITGTLINNIPVTNSGGTTVNGIMATGATYTNNGTTTVNGTFQINAGGYADGTTNLTYGTSGTLIFNHSPNGVYGVNSGTYWPGTNGPVNVTLNANSPVNLGLARTVTGVFATSAALTGASNLTITGTNQINSTAASFDAAVNYGPASTLVYNSGSTFNRSNEWNNNPTNVILQNSTLLNYPNGWGAITRTLNGNLTVGPNSALYMDYDSPSTGVGVLTVKGNVIANGNISLGNQSAGNMVIGGNFSNAATFSSNGRKVTFNGTGAQTISGATTFSYLEYNSSSASNNLTINNNITVNNELRFTTGLVSLASGVLVNMASGSSIVATSGNFNSSSSTGTVVFLGAATTNGTINFYPAVAQTPSSLLGVAYSVGSTIQNTLTLNSNSFITSAPKYALNSTLIYNNGGNYARGVEWGSVGTTFPANGYPHHVTIQNGTVVNIETGLTGNLRINGNLNLGTAASAGSLNMQNTGYALEVKGNVTIGNTVGTSTLTLSTNFEGDLSVGGNWIKNTNGVLVSNSRAVTFNGVAAQTLTGNTTFDYLTLNNSAGLTLSGSASSIVVNQTLGLTAGKITLGSNNLTIGSGGAITGGSTSNYVVTNSTGVLKWLSIGNVDKIFPVGYDTTYYAPVTIRNTTGTSDLSVKVNNTITNAVYDNTKVISQEWLVNSSAATTATITPVWAGAKQSAGISNPGPGELGNYVSSYTVYPTSLVSTPQNQTTATGVALASGNNYIVVGSTGAVYTAPPANDTCSNATVLTVNATAVSGTLNGATKTGTSVYPDVFYKFTPSITGTYSITINNFSTGDRDLYVYTSCPSVVPGSALYRGEESSTVYETITNTFTSGTTYYIAVYDYQTAKGTFDIRITASPVITVNPTSLAFGTVTAGSLGSDSFNLSAELLTVDAVPANNKITVTAPTGFKVSLNNATWSSSVDVPYTTSSLAATPIYVIVDGAAACGSTTGNITFATANLSASPTVALSATLVVPIPTAIEATDSTATTFTAHWNVVPGATGYELDVYQSSTASSPAEAFNNPYSTTATGWTSTDATAGSGGAQYISMVKLTSVVISAAVDLSNYTVKKLNFKARTFGGISASNNVVTVSISTNNGVNWTVLGTYTPTNATLNSAPEFDLASYSGTQVKIRFQTLGANGSVGAAISNLVLSGTQNVVSNTYAVGYNPKTIVGGNVSSYTVSGLSPNTIYNYRLRAVSNNCTSPNSNVITATTNNTVVWSGTEWSNTSGPTASLDAKVVGAYGLTKSFETKDLEVTNSGSISVSSNFDVTVNGAVINNGSIIVNSDANFVQKTGSSYAGSGTFTVLRNAKVPSTQFNYWSSPIFGSTSAGQNMYSIYANIPANRVQIYNTANDRFVTVPNPTYGAPGIGYSIKGPSTNTSSSSVTATFTGTTPNNGDISVALNRVGFNYNLVGNPYPSNLDLNTFYTDNTSVLQNGTFWLWDNTNNTELTQLGTGYTGNSYATWNASGNVGVSGTSTVNSPAKTPTRYASVAQGFIVEANPAATGSLVFKNSERVSNTGVFFASKTQEQTDAYWLQLITPSGVVNTTAVVYNQEALNTLDKFDSGLGILGSDSFYSFADADTSELIIQGRKGDLNLTDIVPLGATSFSPGNHSIRLSDRRGIFESGQKIYLHDKLLNQYQDLTAGDYSFNMNKGTINSRFEIVYKDAAVLGNSDVTKSDFRVYRHQDKYIIESSKKLGQVELYDAGGRMIRTYKTDSKLLEMDVTTIPSGVYVIKAENSGAVKTKKIRR